MFVGHYSVAFACRTERNKIPLWVLFVAVQFDDLDQPQPDENVLTIELGRTPEEIVERIEAKLNLAGSG